MKSLVSLLQMILQDMEDRCHVSTTRDLKTIMGRLENEGSSFLMITLANYGKDFQKSLDRGYVDHDLFTGFQFRGGLPEFLGGFLDLCFQRDTGRIHSNPDVDAIFCIRQLTLMFAKVRIETSEKRNRDAISKYMECESDVRTNDRMAIRMGPGPHLERGGLAILGQSFHRIRTMLFGSIFAGMDFRVNTNNLLPKHGPGSTSDHLSGNQKWRLNCWTDRLEAIFPSGIYASANFRDYLEREFVYQDPGAETPVRVITVPKDAKGPRIIAIEPTAMQYMQQALLHGLLEEINNDSVVSSLIGFDDQTPNQRMAQIGSRDGTLATLDLSEASDRVSNQHVRALLSRNSLLAEAVDACRSRKADVPGHGVIRLAKFASMGSALTFPLEAIIFLIVVMIGIESALNRPITMKDIKSLRGKVRIYGDDIIIPVEYTSTVVSSLETFGFKVNSGKSFWTGKFRESCGKDYYDGVDITTIRLRSLLPTQQWNKEESEIVISAYSFRNQAYKAGLWKTVRYMDGLIADLKWPTPSVHESSPGLGFISYVDDVLYGTKIKWDENLQIPVILALTVKEKRRRNSIDGYPALLKWFSKRDDLPFIDEDHLLYSGRPRSVDIKLRWVSPH